MITLEHDRLNFRFPEMHPDAVCSVSFQRTLRIPDDNREYPLPPGLGRFPLRHVDDYAGRVPPAWREHGGVLMPMHQSEAMWMSFGAAYPMAIKVAAGKVNVLTGDAWSNDLRTEPQDYLVVPGQPWFDYYGGDKVALDGARKLAGMQSVAAKSWQTGAGPLPGNDPATPQVVKTLSERQVRDTNW